MNLEELKKPLPLNAIKSRVQSGHNLSYIEGYYVIDTANEIFGFGKWDKKIVDLRFVSENTFENKGKLRHDVHYICIGRVTVEDTTFEDVGYGNGMSYTSTGEAHELAVKEAVTDCMKRCFRHFGSRFGNSLYDKGGKLPTPPEDDTPIELNEKQVKWIEKLQIALQDALGGHPIKLSALKKYFIDSSIRTGNFIPEDDNRILANVNFLLKKTSTLNNLKG